jgi:hypothetical protein
MSTPEQDRAGMCAAYGCPLFGTVGSDGRWFCFCHVNKPTVLNDSITRVLREEQAHIVDASLSIRRHLSSFFGEDAAYREIQRLLIEGGRKDLLMSASEKQNGGCRAWLQRLERELIDSVASIGEQKRIPMTVPTAPVVGPTHATEHFSDEANRLVDRLPEMGR